MDQPRLVAALAALGHAGVPREVRKRICRSCWWDLRVPGVAFELPAELPAAYFPFSMVGAIARSLGLQHLRAPTWSPDGRMLAAKYAAFKPGKGLIDRIIVWSVDPMGAPPGVPLLIPGHVGGHGCCCEESPAGIAGRHGTLDASKVSAATCSDNWELAFCATDSTRLASLGGDYTVRVWDLSAKPARELHRLCCGGASNLNGFGSDNNVSLAFSGSRLAVLGGGDSYGCNDSLLLIVWDLDAGEGTPQAVELQRPEQVAVLRNVFFLPDGRVGACGDASAYDVPSDCESWCSEGDTFRTGRIVTWELPHFASSGGSPVIEDLQGLHGQDYGEMGRWALSPDRSLVAASFLEEFVIADLASRNTFFELTGRRTLKCISHDNQYAVITSTEGRGDDDSRTDDIWSLREDRVVHTFGDLCIQSCAFSPDGRNLAVFEANRISIWR